MILASLTLPPRDSFNNPQPLPAQYVSRVSLPFPGTVIITASAGTVIDAYSTGGTLLGSGTSSLSFSTTESNIVIVFTKPSAGIITVELLPVAGDGAVPTPPGSGDVLTSTGSAPTDYGWAPPGLSATALQGVAISATAPTNGQALEYNGTEWVPTTPSSNATELQGVALSATAPTDGQVIEYNGTEWVPSTPSSSGGLLARKSYNPSTAVSYSLSSTMTAVDTTNLAVTFTAPSSGSVLVALESVNTGNGVAFGVISGGSLISSSQEVNSLTDDLRSVATVEIAGLTAGDSYTYDFGAKVTSGGGTLYAGGSYGSASIAVWEAP